jgi:hypothetical protein
LPTGSGSGKEAAVRAGVLDPFGGCGGLVIKNLVKLMEATSGLIVALSILLAVVGVFYR